MKTFEVRILWQKKRGAEGDKEFTMDAKNFATAKNEVAAKLRKLVIAKPTLKYLYAHVIPYKMPTLAPKCAVLSKDIRINPQLVLTKLSSIWEETFMSESTGQQLRASEQPFTQWKLCFSMRQGKVYRPMVTKHFYASDTTDALAKILEFAKVFWKSKEGKYLWYFDAMPFLDTNLLDGTRLVRLKRQYEQNKKLFLACKDPAECFVVGYGPDALRALGEHP
ncbi:MAG TPA: hypothetical protein VEA59_01850 [Patescibacteria group bacterium]|nr:hypothetical protein [Patescibacteria group bacterium]